MRIDELVLPQTIHDAEFRLQQSGYKTIGRGSFAKVFKRFGSNYVLKLFHSRDIPYINFIKISKKLQNNKYFPKVIGNLIKINDNYSAVRIEQLSVGSSERIEEFADMTYDYIDSIISKDEAHPDTMNIINSNTELKRACDLIAKICIITGAKPDLGFNNIMMRGMDYVFIDPIYDEDLWNSLHRK